MRKRNTLVLLLMFLMMGCAEKGVVNVKLNQGYSEFTIQSKHKEIKSVGLKVLGESSCEVAINVSKQPVDTIGSGTLNFEKTYPWRAGAFKVKVYSPRCTEDEQVEVRYTFNR